MCFRRNQIHYLVKNAELIKILPSIQQQSAENIHGIEKFRWNLHLVRVDIKSHWSAVTGTLKATTGALCGGPTG